MGKRTLLNLVLLLVVGGLGLLAAYKPGKEAPPAAEPLTPLSPAQIDRVRIERPGQPAVVLARADGRWQMREPLAAPANEMRLDSLLRLAEAKVLGRFPAPAELAGYGLAEPAVTVTLNDGPAIAFGNTTPVDQRRYVLRDGAIHLIADTTFYFVSGDWGGFVDPRPVPADLPLTAIEVPGLSVTRGEGGWQAVPAPEGLSADAVVEFVDSWKHARAFEVTAWQGDAQGEPVTLRSERGEPIHFTLTAREPLELVRTDLGLAYHLPGSQAATLLQLPRPPADGPAE
jgi:hypothetical protein